MRNSTRDNVLHDDFLKRIEELEKQVQELKLSSQEQEVPIKMHECKALFGEDVWCREFVREMPPLHGLVMENDTEENGFLVDVCPFCGYMCEE